MWCTVQKCEEIKRVLVGDVLMQYFHYSFTGENCNFHCSEGVNDVNMWPSISVVCYVADDNDATVTYSLHADAM